MALLRILALSLLGCLPLTAVADTILLMAEEEGCVWCERWDREISAIYPKTDEGRAAPLLRHDIRAELPQGIALAGKLQFTPTFVLLRDGQEIGRIEGYPGEAFFWGLLGQMLAKTRTQSEETG